MLTDYSVRRFADHLARQEHALAGATIAASAALACGLGEACVRIGAMHLADADQRATAERTAGRLVTIRGQLQALADEDGDAILAFAALRDAGQELQGQDRLCQMPVETGRLSAEAAAALQEFRSLVQVVQDDLEMAITLLGGAVRAATLLLDSNLRIWPEAALRARFEPGLADLRSQAQAIRPVERIRQ